MTTSSYATTATESGWITARGFLGMCLAAAVFASALCMVSVRHEGRKAYVELARLEQERDRLQDDWGRLQLEQATARTQAQVEAVAHRELSMTVPSPDDIVLMVSP
ncbi:MAG: cell division protein FtsL [Candidatus Rokuibacteriota bacterium]